jgi:branched-chain amino acid transport system substrate-binding protein
MAGGALAALAAPAALTATAARAQDGEPIHIGLPAPLTGVVAADGIEFENGARMAVEEINAEGGILGRPLELHVEDTQSMGNDVVSQAAQRLVDRSNVSVLIAGYNLETGDVLHDVAADAGICALHVNTVIAHDQKVLSDPARYWGTFMIDPPETYYGIGLLDFLKSLETGGQFAAPNRKLAIITGPAVYSVSIANNLRDNAADFGWEVSLFESVAAPISEWGPTLAKLRADPPGVIAVTHFFAQDQAQFMTQFMTDPTNSLVYMQYGASLAAFRDIAGDASVGVLYSTVIGVLQDEIGNGFRDAYLAKFGPNSAPNGGVQTYTCLKLWAQAAAIAGGPGAAY